MDIDGKKTKIPAPPGAGREDEGADHLRQSSHDVPLAESAESVNRSPGEDGQHDDSQAQQTDNDDLPRWRLYLMVLSLGVTNLLIALDTSILGPAIPAITSEFRTLDHIGWYVSAYLLTLMPLQLVLSRLVAFYDPKTFYMLFTLVFEVGSTLCASAPSSPVFVLGRAMAGVGAGGITAGTFAVIGRGTPRRERPRLMACFAALQAVAYTAGPTLSGALTDTYLTVCIMPSIDLSFKLTRTLSGASHFGSTYVSPPSPLVSSTVD